jgi:hypothetical protein
MIFRRSMLNDGASATPPAIPYEQWTCTLCDWQGMLGREERCPSCGDDVGLVSTEEIKAFG